MNYHLCDLLKFFFLTWFFNQFVFRLINGDCTGKFSDLENRLNHRLEPLKGIQFKIEETRVNKENKTDHYEYILGICAQAKPDDKEIEVPKNAGMIQIKTEEKPKHVNAVGLFNETELLGGDNWILMRYKNGTKYKHCQQQNRQALIMITCGPSLHGKLVMIEEHTDESEECYYLFQLESSVACTPEDGLSAGSIFCIILLTTVGLYLLIGFLHQRIVVGAKGLEQIPNFNMWKEFGKLQADGCDFLCRCGERQEAKMYRGIDDQLLNPDARDERDERLLPM